MSRIFFTSDLHLGHTRLVEEFEPNRRKVLGLDLSLHGHDLTVAHDNALIDRINSRVGPNDKLIILGDVSLASSGYIRDCVGRILCNKSLIRGNHDKHTDSQFLKMDFDVVCYEMTLKISKNFVRLSHYPYRKPWWKCCFPWQYKEKDRHKRPIDYGHWLLHGHTHSGGHKIGDGAIQVHGRQINVGVDCWECYPVPLDKIEQIIQRAENYG